MNKYRSLHLWMIIPMVFMQLGIFRDYWGDFSENGWSVHVHYWTGTVWYLFLIFQPYLATHGKLPLHRTYGIIGMFLAGGVCLTALSMMHRDLANADRSAVNISDFGPFEPWFFMGVAAIEIVMMVAFGYVIIQSILHRKKLEDHAWWLISSVFIIMMPALGRGIQNLYVGANIKSWPDIDIMFPLYISQVLIIAMILSGAWMYGKFKHPATFVAVGVNLFILFLEPLGRSVIIQQLLRTMIKG